MEMPPFVTSGPTADPLLPSTDLTRTYLLLVQSTCRRPFFHQLKTVIYCQRHLLFLDRNSTGDESPLLPSFQTSIFQLSVTTVGRHVTPQYSSLQEKRRKVAADMKTYLKGLTKGECVSQPWDRAGKGRFWKPAESVVRSFAVHDEHEFSIQQQITIDLEWDRGTDIWKAIIWLDSGTDLRDSPWGPWLDSATDLFFFPSTLYKSRVALKSHQYPGHEPWPTIPERSAQSISLLPLAFGRSLNPKVMRQDPFYALSEILNFVAVSEMQLLTAIERHINLGSVKLQGDSEEASLSSHADLFFFRNLLEDHVNKISETNTFIRNRHNLKWPRSNSDIALNVAHKLDVDYDALLDRARLLRNRCEREMNVILSKAQLAEAKRGILKTKKALTLTVLAIILLPGTATATVFGMNFVQFAHAWQGAATWIISTTTLMAISYLAVRWDEGLLQRLWKRTSYTVWH
ncbi:MAG: hypothetical protein Q9186_000377 [Xanthomendoza sp. 1 TL-2023]